MANIFQQFAQPVRSVSDYMGDYQQQEGNKLALAAKRMQMQQAQQGMADDQQLRSLYASSGGDQKAYRNALVQAGLYKPVQAMDAADLAAQKTRADIGKTGAETDDKRIATVQKRIETAGQVFGFVKDNPTVDNAIAAAQHLGEQGIWDAATVAKAVQSIQANPTPENVRNLATQAYQNALSAKDQLPQLFNQNRGGTFAVQSVNPVTGAAKDASVAPITQSADNAASQATALARIASSEKEGAAQRGVQIRGQNLSDARARETIAQGGKAPAGYRFKPDGSMEAIPGGPADLKQVGALNQDTQSLTSSTAAMDRLENAANEILNHPGLAGITGLRGKIPNVPGTDAADAEALLNTLKSQIAFGVLQDMRNNSKTGGALGNVSDAEGKRLEANLAALEKAQSLEQFKASLSKIKDYTNGAKDRLRQAYNLRHGQGASANASPVAGGPKVGDIENGYRFKGGNPADQKNWEKQ